MDSKAEMISPKPSSQDLSIILLAGLFLAMTIYTNASGPVTALLLYSLLLFVTHRFYSLFNWMDPVVMFVVSYVAFLGVGILALEYFTLDLHPSTLAAILLGLAAFLVGALLADALGSPPGRIKLKRLIAVDNSFFPHETTWVWLVFLTGVFLLLTYYALVGNIPFLSENAETLRVGAVSGLGYILIAGFAFLNVGATLLVAISTRRHSVRSLMTAVVILCIAIALLIGVGYRMPAVRVILSAFIVYHFIRYAKIPKRNLSILIVSLVVLLSMAGFYRLFGQFLQSPADVEFAFRRAIYSLFIRYLYVLSLVIDFFPGDHPFLYGSSYLLSLRTLLPGAQQHFGYWLVDKMGLVLNTPGPVDPTIVGEFYANFGWLGIGLGMSGAGFFLRALYRFFLHSPILPVNRLILITLISTSMIGVTASGIILVLLFDLLPVLIVFACYRLCSRLRVSKSPKHLLPGVAEI